MRVLVKGHGIFSLQSKISGGHNDYGITGYCLGKEFSTTLVQCIKGDIIGTKIHWHRIKQ